MHCREGGVRPKTPLKTRVTVSEYPRINRRSAWEEVVAVDMMWANSGDSHFLEREDLYATILPPELAHRMPRAVTYGHTQETLHGLFDGLDDQFRYRITVGSFLDLFPDVGAPPDVSPDS
jgi:hypothetical protein